MPVSHHILPDLGLIFIYVSDSVLLCDLTQYEQIVSRDPLRRPDMRIIVDLARADLEVDLDSIKRMAFYNRRLNASGWKLEPTAVVTSNPLLVSLANVYELMAHNLPLKLKMCLTLNEALCWLELQSAQERVNAVQTMLAQEHLFKLRSRRLTFA